VTDTKVVLFDIDGTLITTGGAGGRAWSAAFQKLFGVPGDITRFSEVGMTDPDVARQTFEGTLGREPNEDELARLIMGYVMALPEQIAASTGYRVLPGVVDLLSDLAASGVLLGLVTGNIEGAAHIKIMRGDLNRYFAFGGYGSDAADRGELTQAAIDRAAMLHGHALPPQGVFVVGDTPRDVDAARYVGAVSVAVATGEYTVDQLRATGADHVLASLENGFPRV
jgi:phosphoglycolate phosphatase